MYHKSKRENWCYLHQHQPTRTNLAIPNWGTILQLTSPHIFRVGCSTPQRGRKICHLHWTRMTRIPRRSVARFHGEHVARVLATNIWLWLKIGVPNDPQKWSSLISRKTIHFGGWQFWAIAILADGDSCGEVYINVSKLDVSWMKELHLKCPERSRWRTQDLCDGCIEELLLCVQPPLYLIGTIHA